MYSRESFEDTAARGPAVNDPAAEKAGLYLQVNPVKIELREYAFGLPGWQIPVFALLRALHVPVPFSTDDPPVLSIAPFQIPEEQLPNEVREHFAPWRQEIEAEGFHSPIFHAIDDPLHTTKVFWATFAHPTEPIFARIHLRIWNLHPKPKIYLFPIFGSICDDGTVLLSSGGKQDLLMPPNFRSIHMPKAAAAALLAAHRKEFTRLGQGRSHMSTATAEHVRLLAEWLQERLRDFHVGRGVFRPLKEEEKRRLETYLSTQSAAQGSLQHPEVHAEIQLAQTAKAGWGNAMVILLASAAGFLAAGAMQWNWSVVAMLIPILLFHELGHWIAMRVFNYRNMRMFFIPFFGAAVSGQNYNVPGWKKVIVSLMGPVPGIVLGAGLGFVGLTWGIDWLSRVAFLTLVLNGINLLPILPLDGGWIMHAILFSRHIILDVAFRIFALAGLLAWSFYGGGKVMMYVAILMAIGLPTSIKLAAITARVRKQNLPTASADDQTIPVHTADGIIETIHQSFKGQKAALAPKMVATRTLSIFETLNARPPGWFASLLFSLVHLGSLVVAIVAASFLLVGRQKGLDLAGLLSGRAFELSVRPAAIQTWPEGASLDGPLDTLVATFPKRPAMNQLLSRLTNDVPPGAAVTRFGLSLLVGVPQGDEATRAKLIAEIETATTNFFVCSSNFPATFSLSCRFTNEATLSRLESELSAFFAIAREFDAIPPWHPHPPEPAESARHTEARQAFVELSQTSWSYRTNKEAEEIRVRRSQAQRTGDARLLQELEQAELKLQKKLLQERIDAMRSEPGSPEALVAALFEKLPADNQTNAASLEVQQQLGVLLGATAKLSTPPAEGNQAEGSLGANALRYNVTSGYVSQEKSSLDFGFVTFRSLFHGAPQIVRWLHEQGATHFTYWMEAIGDFEADPDEE